MGRSKTETKEREEEEKEDAALDTHAGPGETMNVVLKGPADAVTSRLGLNKPRDGAGGEKPPGDNAEKASERFFTLLQDASLVAVVARTQPASFNGINCRAEVDRYPLPEDWQSIKDQVAASYGGGKYRVALINPQNGRTMGAQNFEVPGDPILQEVEEIDPQFDEEPVERSPLDQVKDLTEKEIQNATAEAELITARRRLAALRNDKDGVSGSGTDPRVQALEKQIQDLSLRAIEERHQRELAELKRQIDAKATPAGESASDKMFQMMMQQMKSQSDLMLAQQKSSDEKFTRLMEQAQNQKLDAISSELRELKRTKEDGGLKGQIEMVKSIADLLGVPLGGDKDDDEDKTWYEKLAEDSLPRIIDILEGKSKKGESVTKEQLMAEIEKEADRVIAEKTASGQLPPPPRPHAARPLPAAPAARTALPPPAPAAGSPDLPPPPPGTAAAKTEPAALPTVEEERQVRCANVMVILERELMFRPKEFQWNFAAWQNLPEDALERFATAADLPAAIGTFDGILNAEGLAKMKGLITADDRVKAWVSRGFKELQGWWQEALKNPDFDPANEDEEEDSDDL